ALLSPKSVVVRLRTQIYLLHDTSDQYVPFTESRDFAAALTSSGKPHDFVELSIFQHVEVRSGNGVLPLLGDGARLYGVVFQMLQVAG
ncbi:MAG TPA: hypothetical protein VF807_00005, partial [Ktedonobacterales bacterium]